MGGPGSARRAQAGQVLVIFALSIVVLLAGAGLAFDVGRFYSERRFLQNAADAAALAATNALSRGATVADADAEARSVLTRNFVGNPSGPTPALPPTTPVYASGHAGDPVYLVNGILISGSDVRVAVLHDVSYTFGRAIGLGDNAIGAQARAVTYGKLLPIAVRRWVNAPGPNVGAAAPCPDNQSQFLDFFATTNTACLGTDTDATLRTLPSPGDPFDPSSPGSDPTNHGPIVAILGQGADPGTPADFRGFIALDIRNFAVANSQSYYNGVTAGTNAQILKDKEAAWILQGGYPGPALPPVTSPPDPNDQVAVMSGNNTGVAIAAMNVRYRPGDEILVAVYPGIVNAIPDFSLTQPAPISLPTTGTVNNAGTFKMARNDSFSGTVTLSTLADANDPANPMVLGTLLGGATPITYDPNPVSPTTGSGQVVQMRDVSTSGALDGVYALWLQAEAGSPYLTTKTAPISVVIGSVVRDFAISSDVQAQLATSPGSNVVFNLTLKNYPVGNTSFGGPVTLSVDGPLPTGVGAVTFGSALVTPNKNGNSTSLTINTGTMAPGRYTFVVRAFGMNADSTPRPVTHLLPLTVDVPPVLTGQQGVYIDIVGFAVMRLVYLDGNSVTAYAITPVIADMHDERLRHGQAARLVPWN